MDIAPPMSAKSGVPTASKPLATASGSHIHPLSRRRAWQLRSIYLWPRLKRLNRHGLPRVICRIDLYEIKARLRRAVRLRAALTRRPRPLTRVCTYPVLVIPAYHQLSTLAQPKSAISYGDLPTWIVALATVCALVAAFRAALYAKRLFETEAARDARTEQRDLRAQAEHVSAWIQAKGQTIVAGSFTRHIGIQLSTALVNSSTQPVYDLTMSFSAGHVVSDVTDTIDVLPPLTKPAERPLPKKAQTQLEAAMQTPGDETPRVALEFTDAAGRRWRRAADGTLDHTVRTVDNSYPYDQGS